MAKVCLSECARRFMSACPADLPIVLNAKENNGLLSMRCRSATEAAVRQRMRQTTTGADGMTIVEEMPHRFGKTRIYRTQLKGEYCTLFWRQVFY